MILLFQISYIKPSAGVQLFIKLIMTQKLIFHRLQKQEASMDKQPIPNALVTRQGHLNFHFCLYNLEGCYAGGIYHGLFELHENYPFNAPKLYFYTPSGRFQINLPICTSFTNYHQETWTSAWNVRSLILATISFMYSQEPSYGCRSDDEATRKHFAQTSLKYNFSKIEKFANLFGKKLVQAKIITEQELDKLIKGQNEEEKQKPQPQVEQKKQQNNEVELVDDVDAINQQFQVDVEPADVHLYVQKGALGEPLLENKDPQRRNPRGEGIRKVLLKGAVFVGIFGVCIFLICKYK